MAKNPKMPFPIPAFSFNASIEGSKVKFMEISGLKATVEFKEVKSGGMNDAQYKIPTNITYGDVVLKKGVMKTGDDDKSSKKLYDKVFKDILKMNTINPLAKQYSDIIIQLTSDSAKNGTLVTAAQWTLKNPCLISWELSPFNATANELAFETLTFSVSKIITDYK